jgi:hypothetical protein
MRREGMHEIQVVRSTYGVLYDALILRNDSAKGHRVSVIDLATLVANQIN